MVAHGRPSDEGCRRPPEFPPRGRQVVFGNREADRDVCAATLRSHPPRACIEVQRLRLSIRKNEADPEGFESRNDDKRRTKRPNAPAHPRHALLHRVARGTTSLAPRTAREGYSAR